MQLDRIETPYRVYEGTVLQEDETMVRILAHNVGSITIPKSDITNRDQIRVDKEGREVG